MKHQSCALSFASEDKPAGPWAFPGATAAVGDVPPVSLPWPMAGGQRRSSDDSSTRTRCDPASHLQPASTSSPVRDGEEVRTGLPSPAQPGSSASLGHGHSPDTQTPASALCCTQVSLWVKSTSKHRLSGRERKTKGHVWVSRSLGEPGEPHSLQLQVMVEHRRPEQDNPSMAWQQRD